MLQILLVNLSPVSTLESFNYEKLNEHSSAEIREDWGKFVTPEKMLYLDEFISEYNIGEKYLIKDQNKIKSVFQIITVKPNNACKNLKLYFSPNVENNIKTPTDGNLNYAASLMIFSFQSLINITHDDKKLETCKIYSPVTEHADFTHIVFRLIAKELLDKEKYTIKTYGRWIEVKKK